MVSEAQTTPASIFRLMENCDGNLKDYLDCLLAMHCHVFGLMAAAVLQPSEQEQAHVISIFPSIPQQQNIPDWLRNALPSVRKCLEEKKAITTTLPRTDRTGRESSFIVLPAEVLDIGKCFLLYWTDGDGSMSLDTIRDRLDLTLRFCLPSKTNPIFRQREHRLTRIQMAMTLLLAVNRQSRFRAMAMAFCNEVNSHWECERSSLGFLRGRYVRLVAVSHIEHFSRKMDLVQQIELAMEECLDQDSEILFPSSTEDTCVTRAAGELARDQGSSHILSMPLRNEEGPMAVLTLERPKEKPFTLDEIEAIRLTCELCTPQLASTYLRDRWIGARAVHTLGHWLSVIMGPRHTWAKMAVVFAGAFLLFSIIIKGQYKVEAPFVVEAVRQQVIPAPFNGYLKSVAVEVGDHVEATTRVLAVLDTAELRLQLAATKAEKTVYLKQAAAAMRDGQTAQAQIAQSEVDRLEAQLNLLEYQVQQASIVSPLAGLVVKGDLQRQIEHPVSTGDVLFEVAPLEALRAQLSVPEADVVDLQSEQEGYLATFSYPDQKMRFVIERIDPIADIADQRNVFKVRVELSERPSWLRPGMEGVAKVHIDKRSYLWIWTHKVVNWIRMKLWI